MSWSNQRPVDRDLHFAAQRGSVRDIVSLLDRHANVNARDNLVLNTPLHYASLNGHRRCIQVLIDHGANKSITNVRHPSHLSVPSLSRLIECILYLLILEVRIE